MSLQRLSQRFWSVAFKWQYRLFQRHRHRRLVMEHFQNVGRVDKLSLVILPDVFNPALFQTSIFLADQIPSTEPRLSVLDMGTGSGLCAVVAARYGHDVVAVDINPEAVRCTQINALLNEVDLQVCTSDLFAAVSGQRFDLILFNPPYYRGEPRDRWEQSWRSTDVVERFAESLPSHLNPNGSALVILSDKAEDFRSIFEQAGLERSIAAQNRLLNETLTIYRLQPARAE